MKYLFKIFYDKYQSILSCFPLFLGGGKGSRIKAFQLRKNGEQMTDLRNYHLKILNNIIGLGKNHQGMLKSLAKKWTETWIVARVQKYRISSYLPHVRENP